ncbi:unnamed protein product, partial [Sphacelaria rigidula]
MSEIVFPCLDPDILSCFFFSISPPPLQDDIKVASALNNVAGLLATLGRPQEALPLFTRSEDIYSRHLGAQHPHTV